MSGLALYKRYQQVEESAAKLGFRFVADRYGIRDDRIHLSPVEDEKVLPPYNRSATFFAGSLDEVSSFLAGIQWAREYDISLGYRLHKTRPRAEERYVERLRKQREKHDGKNVMRILKGEAPVPMSRGEAPVPMPKNDPPF